MGMLLGLQVYSHKTNYWTSWKRNTDSRVCVNGMNMYLFLLCFWYFQIVQGWILGNLDRQRKEMYVLQIRSKSHVEVRNLIPMWFLQKRLSQDALTTHTEFLKRLLCHSHRSTTTSSKQERLKCIRAADTELQNQLTVHSSYLKNWRSLMGFL